ncbi:hypothetical protein ACFVAD_18815 [Sutcliffiella sp. NPDC057660]|uniref:hypothetical protein n=1 Tax=Sutcliffiella sp. NPDC057660 TaxID=3346199 RepID=UPI0036C79CD8
MFLCEREKGDPFLSKLVSINVLDIFNTPAIDIQTFTEQLQDKPRFKTVAGFLNLDTTPSLLNSESQLRHEKPVQQEEKTAPVKTEEAIPEVPVNRERPVINKVINKQVVNKVVEKKIVQKNVIKKQYQLNVTKNVEKVIGVTIEPKLILVGSPFRRTGSTFFAHTLSKYLGDSGVGVTYIENPFQQGYTYDRFYGHENAQEYISLFSQIAKEARETSEEPSLYPTATTESHQNENCWIHENIRLLATNPMKESIYVENDISLHAFMKLLLSLHKTPFIIIDVGTEWSRELYRELYSLADSIYLVLEPDIPLIERFETSEEHGIKKLRGMLKAEKVHLVGNRMTPYIAKELFDNQVHLIPNIPANEIFSMQFKGQFLPDSREIIKQLNQAFNPIIQTLLPKEFLKKKGKEESFLKSIFSGRSVELRELEKKENSS